MRLLLQGDNGEVSLTKDFVGDDVIPPYAILSHTWHEDQEVTYEDLSNGTGECKTGYGKIRFCGQKAECDGLKYFWVDTCCINKSNSAELSEAIISMFRWYRDAARCYVYLTDVTTISRDPTAKPWLQQFRDSRWFTRGWTLQELIAPSSVEFFSVEGQLLGSKGTLMQEIHDITGIAVKALQGHNLSQLSIAERLSWAQLRNTKREEDKAYALLGIFNVNMPPLYGEGVESAFRRLHEEIGKSSRSGYYKRGRATFESDDSNIAETTVTRLQQNIASRSGHVRNLADMPLTENLQYVQELMALLSSMKETPDRIVANSLHDATVRSALSISGPKRKLRYQRSKRGSSKNKSRSKQVESTLPHASLPGSFPAEDRGLEVQCNLGRTDSSSHCKIGTSDFMADTSRAICAVFFTLLYANPRSRKLAGRLWTEIQADPMFGLLCLMCLALVRRCVLHIPKQISLLSDNSIRFEDCFGIEIRVPYQQCEQFEFFHGFLEYYFRQRPGLQRVMQKRYRLFLGSTHGQDIERSSWTNMVRPRTRMTMAMLLVCAQDHCVKCFGKLESRGKAQIRICFACDQEYSVETLTAHQQQSTSTITYDDQVSELRQLDSTPRHPIELHEAAVVASPTEPANNVRPRSNSDQGPEASTQKTTANDNPYTMNEKSADHATPRAKSSAKQENDSVLRLELKLFKNMAFRVVPRDAPLRPLSKRDKNVDDDDNFPTIANATETSEEEFTEKLRPEYLDLEAATHSPILGRNNQSPPEILYQYDDMSIAAETTRHVDYLSYEWDVEDLISSWRYVARRRQIDGNPARLENAAWRYWAQDRNDLKTVSPESLNWRKEYDVTWLYGPFRSKAQGSASDGVRDFFDAPFFPTLNREPILGKKISVKKKISERETLHVTFDYKTESIPT